MRRGALRGPTLLIGAVGIWALGMLVFETHRVWQGVGGGVRWPADALGVGVGLVFIYGWLRWGAELARSGGRGRLAGFCGGWTAAGLVAVGLWALPGSVCRVPIPLWLLWTVTSAWVASIGTGERREANAAAVIVSLVSVAVYSVTVFPLLPPVLGGGRLALAPVQTDGGVSTGGVTRWRSGYWIYTRDCELFEMPWTPEVGVRVGRGRWEVRSAASPRQARWRVQVQCARDPSGRP